MNYKKIFFSVMMVALAATMSVGLTSCKDDDVKVKIDPSLVIMGKWGCNIDRCKDQSFEINTNLTYSYEHPEVGSGSGTYRILKTLKNQELRLGYRETSEPEMATLFIIAVTPNGVFDQIWVYHFQNYPSSSQIAVDYYFNNQPLTDFLFALSNLNDYL